MSESKQPMAEANRISKLLTLCLGKDRFPVNIEAVAKEISQQRYPASPITKIEGMDLTGFDGLLKPNKDRTQWLIVYNSAVSPGRQRFTLAHEFGHFILHRDLKAEFTCHPGSYDRWDAFERQIETEADLFASTLLMPLDDFRCQVEGQPVSFDLLDHCAERYGVSLTAAALRWTEISPQRVVLIASRDDYMLWAKSNPAALKSGAYFATRKNTFELPRDALAHSRNTAKTQDRRTGHAQSWFLREPDGMPVTELIRTVDSYDYTLTLLLLPKAERQDALYDNTASEEDADDHFIRDGQFPAR